MSSGSVSSYWSLLGVLGTNQGTWSDTFDVTYPQPYRYNSSGTDGDFNTYTVDLPAGTYTCYFIFSVYSDGGKVDVYINGTKKVSAYDTYWASKWSRITSVASVVISSSGTPVAVKFAVNGKNASSSGYFIRLSGMFFLRTA